MSFPFGSLAVGLGLGVMPGLIDSITGVSARRKRAIDQIQSELSSQALDVQQEMGLSAAQSTLYKTMEGQLVKGQSRAAEELAQRAAAGGLTSEAQLGATAVQAEALNNATSGALVQAEARRQRLKELYRQLTMQKLQVEAGEAAGIQQQHAALWQGIATTVPTLFRSPEYGVRTEEEEE